MNHRILEIDFDTSTPLEKWRVDTFWSKEPETIRWIDSLRVGIVLIDIGANIGIYSLYAAYRGHDVLAIEPSSGNYRALTRNIERNAPWAPKAICAMRIGIGKPGTQTIRKIPRIHAGETMSALESGLADNDCETAEMCGLDVTLRRYMSVRGIDSIEIALKVDVDGGEDIILDGIWGLLHKGSRVMTALVETRSSPEAVERMDRIMRDGGLAWSDSNLVRPHSTERRIREGIDALNIIYERENPPEKSI